MEKPQHFDLEDLELVSLKLYGKWTKLHTYYVQVETLSKGSEQITVTKKNANCKLTRNVISLNSYQVYQKWMK